MKGVKWLNPQSLNVSIEKGQHALTEVNNSGWRNDNHGGVYYRGSITSITATTHQMDGTLMLGVVVAGHLNKLTKGKRFVINGSEPECKVIKFS